MDRRKAKWIKRKRNKRYISVRKIDRPAGRNRKKIDQRVDRHTRTDRQTNKKTDGWGEKSMIQGCEAQNDKPTADIVKTSKSISTYATACYEHHVRSTGFSGLLIVLAIKLGSSTDQLVSCSS